MNHWLAKRGLQFLFQVFKKSVEGRERGERERERERRERECAVCVRERKQVDKRKQASTCTVPLQTCSLFWLNLPYLLPPPPFPNPTSLLCLTRAPVCSRNSLVLIRFRCSQKQQTRIDVQGCALSACSFRPAPSPEHARQREGSLVVSKWLRAIGARQGSRALSLACILVRSHLPFSLSTFLLLARTRPTPPPPGWSTVTATPPVDSGVSLSLIHLCRLFTIFGPVLCTEGPRQTIARRLDLSSATEGTTSRLQAVVLDRSLSLTPS